MIKRFASYTFLLFAMMAFEGRAFSETDVNFRASMQWFTVGSKQSIAPSSLNPENKVLKIEDKNLQIDLRPNLKVEVDKLQFIARPQFQHKLYSKEFDQFRSSEKSKSEFQWLEAYGTWTASDKIMISHGIHNYQWGAAESLNPSNRIFHETVGSKSLLYSVPGRNLTRINMTWSQNLSSVFMSETSSRDETATYQAEEVFETSALLKNEFSWNSGADYFGVVLGSSESRSAWVGEYANFGLFDGLSFYIDASHQKSSWAWYPVEEQTVLPGATVVSLKQAKVSNRKIYSLAVGGLRYSFEGGSDLRLEYVYNDAGWSKKDTELGLRAIDATIAVQLPEWSKNAARWAQPGLEFRGQKYALISFRTTDLFNLKDLTFYLRSLRSLQDHSSSQYSSLEYGFFDASTALAGYLFTTGPQDSELKGYVSSSFMAGVRQDF
jgi:hypothetical protein